MTSSYGSFFMYILSSISRTGRERSEKLDGDVFLVLFMENHLNNAICLKNCPRNFEIFNGNRKIHASKYLN
jgi:hypothetical protein